MSKPAPNFKPESMNTNSAHLWFNNNCEQAVAFYQKAFGAELVNPISYGATKIQCGTH